MATSQTAQVGLPFRNTGLARLALGILIGAVVAGISASLIVSGTGVEARSPAPSVDTYTLDKLFQAERSGAIAIASPATSTSQTFDYSRSKAEQVRGTASVLVPSEPNFAKVEQQRGEAQAQAEAHLLVPSAANLAKVTE